MVGLVSPEMISHLNDKNFSFYLNDYFKKNKIDYLVTLRNWFEVANDNAVYIPVNQFEFLEIFNYKADKTHIMPREASQNNQQAIQLLQQKDAAYAERLLQQSLSLDPNSSRTLLLIGAVAEGKNDLSAPESALKSALKIFPDYVDANYLLAKVYFRQERYAEAMNNL